MSFVDRGRQQVLYEKAMHLRFQGMTCIKIAKIVGIRPQSVSTWFSKGGAIHERYQQFCKSALGTLEERSETVAGILKNEAIPSLKTIQKIRDSKKYNPGVRYQCAADLLDRAGYAPVQKTANVHLVDDMGASELDDAFSSIVGEAEKRLTEDKGRMEKLNRAKSKNSHVFKKKH